MVLNYKTPKTDNIKIVVYDVQGKLIIDNDLFLYQNQTQARMTINTNLSGSIYFVNIVSDNTVETHKIVISH